MPNRIREIRDSLHLSQEELADRMGTSYQQVSRLERGERKLTDEWLDSLSKALGCSKSSFLVEAIIEGAQTAASRPRTLPGMSDVEKEDVERRLLDFWRLLGDEEQAIVLGAVDAWADLIIRRSGGG